MVSLIIPTYKNSKTISYCLESVLNQSFKDFECLVVDYPASNDNTAKVVQDYSDRDNRIHYLKSPHKGAMAQREFGIKKAKGDFLCFIDSDDIVDNDYIITLYNNLISNDVDLSICEMLKCKKNDVASLRFQNKGYITKVFRNKKYKMLLKNYRFFIGNPTPVCIMGKKEIFFKACSYYNWHNNFISWEDSILSYYLFFNSSSAVFSKERILYYYINNDNKTYINKNDNINNYLSDCVNVSRELLSIIKGSKYSHYYKQASIYSIFGAIAYLLNNSSIDSFKYVIKTLSTKLRLRDIRVFEKEYTISEKLIAFSIKYRIFPLMALVITKVKRKKRN